MSNDTNKILESSDLIGQRKLRLDKVQKLRDLGIDPYPAKSYRTNQIKEIIDNFEQFEGKDVVLDGRVMRLRNHGKLIFADLADQDAKIQLYIKDDSITIKEIEGGRSLSFEEIDLVDAYDFVEAYGEITKTQRGEISILVKNLRMLAKVIRPLPTSLEDKEERFRRRYVDMAVHPEVRERMKRRALFWQAHRDFFNSKGFYEINIPVLEHVPGGGDAVPFTTHMNALDHDFFLRISHELPLKRLIGGGFEKVYDIGPRFRNEGLSDEHLPEHVAMEFYWAYADWKDGMKLIQEMYKYIIEQVYNGQTKFKIREFEVDFSKDWDVLDFNEIMKERYGIQDVYNVTLDAVKELLTENGIEFDRSVNIARGIDALWKRIRKTVQGPAFLINHPKYLSPLQKPSLDNPNMVERFQPIIAGSELGNGWSEVNDAVDQYDRFVEQQRLRDAGDAEAQWLDVDYVEMLEYGMPPTFGYGHSERVFWFLEDVTAREGVAFPQLKMDFDNVTKEIYPEVFGPNGIMPSHETKIEPKKVERTTSNESGKLPTIEEAQKLLEEHVKDDYQKLHSKMVAESMKVWATKIGEDENLWYLTGLLHDLDYFEHPDAHPSESLNWFKDWGYPESLITAVAEHAFMRTNIEVKTLLGSALIACDELSGFIYAYALMRPDKLNGMDAKGVKKRLKDKAFAAKINREDINLGVEKFAAHLGKNPEEFLNEHIETLISTFKKMPEFS